MRCASIDRPIDNLFVDSEGFVWAAGMSFLLSFRFFDNTSAEPTPTGFPDVWTTLTKHFWDPSVPSPTTSFRFSVNDDDNSTLQGAKYRVETVFVAWFGSYNLS